MAEATPCDRATGGVAMVTTVAPARPTLSRRSAMPTMDSTPLVDDHRPGRDRVPSAPTPSRSATLTRRITMGDHQAQLPLPIGPGDPARRRRGFHLAHRATGTRSCIDVPRRHPVDDDWGAVPGEREEYDLPGYRPGLNSIQEPSTRGGLSKESERPVLYVGAAR